MKFALWVHLRTSEIKTEYCFFKDLERIVFIALGAVETMRFFLTISIIHCYYPSNKSLNLTVFDTTNNVLFDIENGEDTYEYRIIWL